MLVLTRRENESIEITAPGGLPIRVIIVKADRGRVRLGIEADRTIEVVRTELLHAPAPEHGGDGGGA